MTEVTSNFDIFQFSGPLLNRARLYLHRLQCNKELGWDTTLSNANQKEWVNISNQVNAAPIISIDRCVGSREDEYYLVAYTDASKYMCGVVIYLYSVNTNKMNFLLARNKIVGKGLDDKTIPVLEFQGIFLGTETIAHFL